MFPCVFGSAFRRPCGREIFTAIGLVATSIGSKMNFEKKRGERPSATLRERRGTTPEAPFNDVP